MDIAIKWIEAMYEAIPLALLEVWGRFGFLLGLFIMVCAFGGFTFRPGGRWGLGRERQAWDAKALRSLVLTFLLIFATGYVGASIVLVPGAQTFESLKDLSVFVCLLLFGYPALLIVPFAYGLSDLIEGVPPAFLRDWLLGYFINPACFWIAYQLIGKNPDFRQGRTWAWYLVFVAVFMSIEPQLWGYLCAGQFTPEISYRTITPALFFTTAITWVLAPIAMLVALPLARKFGMFWAEIPGHVREHVVGRKEWIWESGTTGERVGGNDLRNGLPVRVFLVTPFIVLVLLMVAGTAYVTLRSAEQSANKIAELVHRQSAENIQLYLDDYLERSQNAGHAGRASDIGHFLKRLPIAGHGQAFILDRSGGQIATSGTEPDMVVRQTVRTLRQTAGSMESLKSAVQFRFDIVTAKPLSRETWLSQATPYQDRSGKTDWILFTATPASFYLEGVRIGNSRSAMVFAIALTFSLALAAYLATIVTTPISRIAHATQAMMKGDLTQRVADSRLEELGALSRSFNNMAEQLQCSFADLRREVRRRTKRERELEESQERVRLSENRLQLAIKAARLGIWDWDVKSNELVWDDVMYQQYGISRDTFGGAYEAWSACLAPEDMERAHADVEAALRGEREFMSEFRIVWPDGSIHYIRGMAHTIRDEDDRPLRMVGINFDITDQRHAAEEIMKLNTELEQRVAERTAQLEAANKELEAFSYSVSHDLKAPLRGIDGYSQLLEETAAARLDEEGRLFLHNIRQSAAQMQTLISDLLAYARMERRALASNVLDLRESLNAVLDGYTREVGERGIVLRAEVPALAVRADPEGLSIILRNLIDNAIKFSRDAHPPTIEIDARKESGKVVMWIRDNGIGFDMKFHERIFEIFSRLQHAEDYAGTGVGLALVRKAAQRMGGHIYAVSAPGRGATFFLELMCG